MKNFDEKLAALRNWQAPSDWVKIQVLDAHTGGKPLRIITGGFPDLQGKSVLERRQYMRQHYDHLRTALLWEPRGHADQYGAVVMPPCSPTADFSVLFIHNEGYSTMCGHAIIALTKVMLETGAFEMKYPETTLTIEVPSGTILSSAHCNEGKVTKVTFRNVPSFAPLLNQEIHVPEIGKIRFDLSFGGAFYAYVNAEDCGVKMIPEEYRNLIEKGMAIKKAVQNAVPVTHPFEEDLSFLYGTIFMGASPTPGIDSRNVCIFADGEVDRSPTGSGVGGRMALHYAKGEIARGEKMSIESLLGTVFYGKVLEETTFGPYPAVIPEVEGTAHFCGKSEFAIDPDDALQKGFFLR